MGFNINNTIKNNNINNRKINNKYNMEMNDKEVIIVMMKIIKLQTLKKLFLESYRILIL